MQEALLHRRIDQRIGITPPDPTHPQNPMGITLAMIGSLPGIASAEPFQPTLKRTFDPNAKVVLDPEYVGPRERSVIYLKFIESPEELRKTRERLTQEFRVPPHQLDEFLALKGWVLMNTQTPLRDQVSFLSSVGVFPQDFFPEEMVGKPSEKVSRVVESQPHVSDVHPVAKPQTFGALDTLEATVSFDDGETRIITVIVTKTREDTEKLYMYLKRKSHVSNPRRLQWQLANYGVVILQADAPDEYLQSQWAKKAERISMSHAKGMDLKPEDGLFDFR